MFILFGLRIEIITLDCIKNYLSRKNVLLFYAYEKKLPSNNSWLSEVRIFFPFISFSLDLTLYYNKIS